VRLDRPELPVIFISAHHDDELRQKQLRAAHLLSCLSRSTLVIC
jgi:hypothetical protein